MREETKQHEQIREELKKYFPIHAQYEYEATVNQSHYPIGVNEDYPADLRERISAATISYISQNKSIDYVRKKYAEALTYEEDVGGTNRKDRIIRSDCLRQCKILIDGIVSFRSQCSTEATIGEFLSDATIVRLHYSMERAFAEADKGALFESLVIIRMALEQFCWAICVRENNDTDEIKKISSTKSITKISRNYPKIGKLNGWLSKHAHWNYDGHIKALFENMGYATKASYMFKACAYIALMTFTKHFISILQIELNDYIDWEFIDDAENKILNSAEFDFDNEYEILSSILLLFYPDIKFLSA